MLPLVIFFISLMLTFFFQCVKYMVEEKGADVKARREDNGGPLATRAAGLGFTKVFKYFIEKGADFDEVEYVKG